jgi:DNA polymerase delta subunit 1
MPEAVAMPQKRVLGDATNNPRGVVQSPGALKKRKIDVDTPAKPSPRTQNGLRKVGSSQPQKSQFEEEVLEKLTQDISDLKQNNSEKDQQWERPPLGEFDPKKENICFQQIDAEDGMAMGKAAIRLFGVTDVCFSLKVRRTHSKS